MTEPIKSSDIDVFVNKAASQLFRYDCPDSIELGEYYLGLGGEQRKGWIKEHTASCPVCATELAGLKSFMAQGETTELAAPQPGIIDKIQWMIADLLRPPQTGLAFAVRGSDDALQSYHAGNYEINVEVSVDTAHPGRKQIVGLILGPADIQMTVGLARAGENEMLSSVALDDGGNFILANVAPGVYDLLLRPADDSSGIRIPALDILA